MVNQCWRLDGSRQLSRHLHTVLVWIPVVEECSLLKITPMNLTICT